MSDYQARPGSTAGLALAYLQAHGPKTHTALAAAIDKETHDLRALLGWAMSKGAIRSEMQGDEWLYSVGDGEPIIEVPQFLPPAVVEQLSKNAQRAVANGHRVQVPSAPGGSPAINSGDSDDDEGDNRRARRLAGGSDDRGPEHGRDHIREQEHGAAKHRAGLLRPFVEGTARQGNADELRASELPKGVAGASRRPETVKETTHRGAAHNGSGDDAKREGEPATPGGLEPSSPVEKQEAPLGLRGKNAALWLTGELAFEAEDGTVIVFEPALAKRMAKFLLPMFETEL